MKLFFSRSLLFSGSSKNRIYPILLMLLTLIIFQLYPQNLIAQNGQRKELSGIVKNAQGETLPGASVVVKGTTIGATTDINGKFSFMAPADAQTLSVTFIGMKPLEIPVAGKTVFDISMETAATTLDEVVVVGYGGQKKVNLTGAVSAVNTSSITNKPVTSLTNSLQGIAPGLAIISRPNDVGKDIGTINIRGRGNLGTSSPLFVVDGVPVSSEDFARINPSDVENVSVLKDASAAIYGSRAAYGVILVTTKKGGKNDAMNIGLNLSYGAQKAIILPSYVGSYEYATLLNESATNTGRKPIYSNEQLEKIKSGNDLDNFPNNNWYKLVLRPTAPLMDAELNISGGGKTSYYISTGILKQASLIPLKGLTRYSLRSNTESQVNRIFKITSNLSFIRDEIKNDGGDFDWRQINRILPLTVNMQSDGSWGSITGGQINTTQAVANPYRKVHAGGWSKDATNRFRGTIGGILQPLEGLEFNGSFTYSFSNEPIAIFKNFWDPIIDFQTKKSLPGTGQQSSLKETWYNTSLVMSQIYGSYEKSINKHYGKLMAGTSYESNQNSWLQAYRTDFPSNSLTAINGGAQNVDLNNGGFNQRRVFISGFSRFNYSYDSKYLLEVNFRADASSQFAPGHRWGYYPSVALGWLISNESFMKSVNWVNTLKLRASWGKLGNISNVGYYDYLDVMKTGISAVVGSSFVNGVWPEQVANPYLSWEVVDSKNIGIDASILNNKLIAQIDLFDKLTDNILLQLPQPSEYGYATNPSTNAAKVSNKGIEAQLTYRNKVGDFDYSVTGNVSKIWNKIVDLKGQDNQISSKWIYKEGESIGSFYMYKTLGLYKDDAEAAALPHFTNAKGGDIKYADLSGPDGKPDGKIDGYDRTIVGNDVPYFTFGLGVNLRYKNFDFAAYGQGVRGVKVLITAEGSQAFFNGGGIKEYSLDRWTKENPNPNATYPRLLPSTDNSQNLYDSDFWLFNANYFRVKTLTLGYTIPANLLQKFGIKSLRVYMSSNNLFTIRGDKRMKDFDPEAPTSEGNFYPGVKTISGGLNLNF